MKDILLILPLVLPLATAVALVAAWNKEVLQRRLSCASAVLQLVAALLLGARVWRHGVCATVAGGWQAPFGIAMAADLLSASMVVVSSLIFLAVCLYALGASSGRPPARGYHPLLHTLMMGVNGAFVTGDIFNLYVWFEVMLISSFALTALGGRREQLEGAVKYAALNLLASTVFLVACGMLYGLAGTLNMADLAVTLPAVQRPQLVPVVAVLFIVAFGIKAGAFPLFFWLPASYPTLASPVAALFAGLLTKVGVYSMMRVFTLVFIQDTALTHGLIAIMALFTMAVGVLGAAAQYDFRRLLSFHIVSQIGYMILALGLYTPAALAGGIFYILHHIVVKSNLFLVAGLTRRYGGSYDLQQLGGFYGRRWWLAVLFIVPAFSLAGLPPLSGFWAKFAVVRAALDARDFMAAGVAIGVGLLTLFSMTKVWSEVFWKPQPPAGAADGLSRRLEPAGPGFAWMVVPVALLATITLAIGLFPEPLYRYALRAAGQLMDRTEYIRAVLEGAP